MSVSARPWVRRTLMLAGSLLLALAMFHFQAQPAMAQNGQGVPDEYIVMLQPNANAAAVANEMAQAHGLGVGHVYENAFKGFSAHVPPGRLSALQSDPRVLSITQDVYVSIEKCRTPPCNGGGGGGGGSTQVVPTGIARINGPSSSTQAGNGSGSVNVDVAIVDTGIYSHSDLNVVGGYNCSTGPSNKYSDGNGHGTHVAGTVGALDNNIGVVGVAPGARLWAVRVLNSAGSGTWASVICGIDWVTAHASTIEVANMSLGGTGSDDGLSCAATTDPMKKALCNATAAGVTFAVAAGNESDNAANHTPAAYDMVITVSALADFNGAPGGGAAPTCRSDVDDTFADFSNFGSDVDIIAPGVCILSTWNDGGYNTISGTSMATPHVTGAAALYLSTHAGASPDQVKAALQNAGSTNWNNADDPDGIKEKLLDVGGF